MICKKTLKLCKGHSVVRCDLSFFPLCTNTSIVNNKKNLAQQCTQARSRIYLNLIGIRTIILHYDSLKTKKENSIKEFPLSAYASLG
ncbi:hypothetical protein DH09_02750 [Bacillaceae bacterium JMAK1]|nr:hypothetical protein DH09_02750 [Bacillaceae bacterium JMAK1]